MKKNIILVLVFVLVVLSGAGCTWFQKQPTSEVSTTTSSSNSSDSSNISGKATRPMMGQDSFGLAVCEEVPKTLVSEVIGKPIIETEDFSTQNDTGCNYYTNKTNLEYVLVKVVYMSAENQKKGQETLDRTITTNPKIPMDHFIAMQADGNINAIYLVMAPEKFVRIDRTGSAATGDQLIALASKVANIILYK